MDWFRLDHGFFNCPKVVRLSREMRSFLVDMWCVSSSQRVRGAIPSADDMAVHWRVKPGRARQVLAKLAEAGFVDEDEATGQLTVHDWHEWQRPSDDAGAIKKAQRSKKSPTGVHGLSMDSPPLDSELDRDKENTPLYPPESWGTHTPRIAQDSVTLDESDPMAERHRVADVAERRWGPQGLDTAESLLNLYPPAVVSYAAEQTFASFGRTLDMHGARTWRKICREHPSGPPASRVASGPAHGSAPPARPLTEHQRKRAKIAELRRTMRDAEADDESVGVTGDGHAHGPARPARRA